MIHILFHTGRFNLTIEGEDFVNPCCYGEDLAQWLQEQLPEHRITPRDTYEEDWGWELDCTHEGNAYGIAIGVGNEHEDIDSDYGQWRIFVINRNHQSLWKILFGKKTPPPPEEPIIQALLAILKKADFYNIHTEEE